MGSSARMLSAGLSALWVLMCCAIYILILGPIITVLVPFLHSHTPEYWWTALGGGMFEWIFIFIYTLIILCGVIIIIRMFAEATRVVDYESGGF